VKEYRPLTKGPERRSRLKTIVNELMDQQVNLDHIFPKEEEPQEEVEQTQEFYTYGPKELHQARKFILQYSIPRAVNRIQLQKEQLEVPFTVRKHQRYDWYTKLQNYQVKSLQLGDDRPIGFCAFSPNSKSILTSSWTGLVKLWNVPESQNITEFKGHTDRVSGIAFHPQATLSQSDSALNFCSGASNGQVLLWALDKEHPIGSLVGHEQRVARLAFHPSGRFIGTSSFDTSWRLWDAETSQELLLQEGHSKEVFAIGFQDDGALVATAYVSFIQGARFSWSYMGSANRKIHNVTTFTRKTHNVA
jgi:U4/U6 small nuclear ribonucleoprotein PRP4